MSSLRSSVKKGLTWSFIDNILVRGIGLFITILLARILEPDDFGLIAIVTIFINLGNALTEGGLGNSIIRDKNASYEDYNAVFYGNFLISIILYPTLYFAAPFIASYFNNIIITDLIRIYGITFIISSFYYTQHSLLKKNLKFKKIAICNTPAIIIGSTVGILSAFNGLGVWSIIYMHITTSFIKSVIYWITSSWRPRLGFSITHLKKHFTFGYKLMISSLINTLTSELNSFIIGKNFNISTLGFYNQSKSFRNYPINMLNTIISSVVYPSLSLIQDDKEKISKIYRQILKATFFFMTFFMTSIIVVTKPLFILIYTEKWLPAVPYFQILAVSGVLIPMHSFNLNVLKIFNRTDLFLKLGLIKIVLVLISLSIGVYFGIYGLLYAITISSFLSLLINTRYSEKFINYSTKQQLKDMFPVVVFAIISFLIGSIVLELLHNNILIIQILISAISTLAIFFILAILTKNKSLEELIEIVLIFLKKNK